MPSIDLEPCLLKNLKLFLLNDDLDDSYTDLLVVTVTDIIEGNYTNLNVLMHCAISICHFRSLLEQQWDKYESTNTSAAFSLVYISFRRYLNNLSERQSRTALTSILENQSLTNMLVGCT